MSRENSRKRVSRAVNTDKGTGERVSEQRNIYFPEKLKESEEMKEVGDEWSKRETSVWTKKGRRYRVEGWWRKNLQKGEKKKKRVDNNKWNNRKSLEISLKRNL